MKRRYQKDFKKKDKRMDKKRVESVWMVWKRKVVRIMLFTRISDLVDSHTVSSACTLVCKVLYWILVILNHFSLMLALQKQYFWFDCILTRFQEEGAYLNCSFMLLAVLFRSNVMLVNNDRASLTRKKLQNSAFFPMFNITAQLTLKFISI